MRQQRIALSVIARKRCREAVQKHSGWYEYARARGVNASMLSGEVLFSAADFLEIDLSAVMKEAGDAARAAAPAVFKPVPAGAAASAPMDWQRVRTICREEIASRVEPVTIEKLVIVNRGKRLETGTGIKHEQFDNLFAALNVRDFGGNRLNVYLYGPTGTGKTYAAAQAAKALGLEFYFHSTAQEAYDLIGYEKVSGELMTTPFVVAFEAGGVCLLDEMDRYDEKALTVINAGLANGKLTLPNGRVIKRHDDFICIGAGNTNGLGATADFTAAATLDKSTLSRFAVKLAWNVSPALEDLAAANRSDNPDIAALWLEECRAARRALDRMALPDVADQRCVEAGANMLAAGLPLALVRDVTYLAGWDADQRNGILQHIGSRLIRDAQIRVEG